MLDKYLGVITQSVLFMGIEHASAGCMLECLNPAIRRYRKNELITMEGDPFPGIGLLLEGEATVSKESFSGSRVVLNLIKPGDIFGEMIAFSEQSAWPATVQAQELSSAIFIPRDRIIGECEKMCPWHRTLITNLLRLVSNRALMLNKKLEFLSIRSMRGKLSAFLLDRHRRNGGLTFDIGMNRNELADFLNVSRPSMSRELGRMKDEGIIDFHLSAVKILSLEALKQAMDNN